MMNATHTITVQVRWGDADPAGIAFYPRFFEWYDLGTATLFESLGLPWSVIFTQSGLVGVPILESGSQFLAPAPYGARLSVQSTVAWAKDKTFRVDHEVKLGETVCARGFEVRAWVARPAAPGERIRATPIPDEVAR